MAVFVNPHCAHCSVTLKRVLCVCVAVGGRGLIVIAYLGGSVCGKAGPGGSEAH